MSARRKISELIMQVLAEKISIQEAIKKFPHEGVDDSAECAFHALLHYEADENYRKQDPEYAQEQVDHLENIALTFQKEESLPVNIIQEYTKYYEKAPMLSKRGIKNILKNLFRLTI